MNPWLPVGIGAAVLICRFASLAWQLWNLPLSYGEKYFFGVAVGDDFYGNEGRRWLSRYRVVLCIQHSILLLAFAIPLLAWRPYDLPIMAVVDVVSFFVLIGGFVLFSRWKLGTHPPQLGGVAVSLEPRRLGDYISWPLEAFVTAVITACWICLLLETGPTADWQMPVAVSYAVLGLLPGKIIIVRNSFPLPPDRPEAHAAWSEAGRRHSLWIMDIMRWYLTAILAAWVARHYLPAGPWVGALQWAMVGVSAVFLAALTLALTRGARRLRDLGQGLRPPGSWAGPFQPARATIRGGFAWGVLYCAGLAAILVAFRH